METNIIIYSDEIKNRIKGALRSEPARLRSLHSTRVFRSSYVYCPIAGCLPIGGGSRIGGLRASSDVCDGTSARWLPLALWTGQACHKPRTAKHCRRSIQEAEYWRVNSSFMRPGRTSRRGGLRHERSSLTEPDPRQLRTKCEFRELKRGEL